MIRATLLLLSFLLFLSSTGFAEPPQYLYLSAGGKLSVFTITGDSGELSPHQEVELAGSGPMGWSPDRTRLYVAAAAGADQPKGTGSIATFEVGADGKVTLLKSAPVNLRPGYLKTCGNGEFLAGNHYGPGKITIWQVEGGVYTGTTIQEVELEPKAHSAVFSADDRFLLVPATGPNKVFQLQFDDHSGKARPNSVPFAPAPQGDNDAQQPRHLVFHPRNPSIVYTTLEREQPGVGRWSFDRELGRLTIEQNIVTQPAGFDGDITTADLHLTPNGSFLYVSNRDVTDRKARTGKDTIVAFKVDSGSGKLMMLGHTPCEHVPRSFVIDETGSYLYVAGQGDDKLGAYRIDPSTGALKRVAQYDVGAKPSWVECMTPPEG